MARGHVQARKKRTTALIRPPTTAEASTCLVTANPNPDPVPITTTADFRGVHFTSTKAALLLSALNKHDAAYAQQVELIKTQLKNSQLAAQVKALRTLSAEQQRQHEAEVAELRGKVEQLEREKFEKVDRHDTEMAGAREAFDELARECRDLKKAWGMAHGALNRERERRREVRERMLLLLIEESDEEEVVEVVEEVGDEGEGKEVGMGIVDETAWSDAETVA